MSLYFYGCPSVAPVHLSRLSIMYGLGLSPSLTLSPVDSTLHRSIQHGRRWVGGGVVALPLPQRLFDLSDDGLAYTSERL